MNRHNLLKSPTVGLPVPLGLATVKNEARPKDDLVFANGTERVRDWDVGLRLIRNMAVEKAGGMEMAGCK